MHLSVHPADGNRETAGFSESLFPTYFNSTFQYAMSRKFFHIG